MLPSLTADNTVYLADRDAELRSKSLLCDPPSGVALPDRHHVGGGEFGMREPFAFYIAAFCGHVFRIIGLRAEKKVFRIYAWRVIAAMQNIRAVWNWTVVNAPRKTVGIGNPALWDVLVKATVAAMRLPRPQPAIVGLAYFFPEPFYK